MLMGRKTIALWLFLVFVVSAAAGGLDENAGGVRVYLAASTTDLLAETAEDFFHRTGIPVDGNPASSGTLARQLEQGAEADIYISASPDWMDYVESLGLIEERRHFLNNRLVLVAPTGTSAEIPELDGRTDFPGMVDGYLSIGDPAHVPAGRYAKEVLDYYGWYDLLESKILPAADVRSALVVVEREEARFGIVYESDALASSAVDIVARFPEYAHSPVEYSCALLKGAGSAGRDFFDYLTSPEALELFTSYGFSRD